MNEFDRVAEDLMAHFPLPPSGERWAAPYAILSSQPGPPAQFATVSAARLDGHDLDAALDEIREWFAARGKPRCIWILGPHSTPTALGEQLLARGAVPAGEGTALVLDREPPRGPDHIDVRVVDSLETNALYREIVAAAIEALDDAALAELRAGHAAGWADVQAMAGVRRNYLAYIDGEAVAAGGLLVSADGYGVLAGGGTRPAGRGQGCYRALVRRRWEDVTAAGARALLVQASPMSAPILERAGFQPLAKLTLLEQRF